VAKGAEEVIEKGLRLAFLVALQRPREGRERCKGGLQVCNGHVTTLPQPAEDGKRALAGRVGASGLTDRQTRGCAPWRNRWQTV
jgi:hypothetical protein